MSTFDYITAGAAPIDAVVGASPSAPVILARFANGGIQIEITVTSTMNDGYKVLYREGVGPYTRFPDGATTHINNKILITGLTLDAAHTVKISGSNGSGDTDSNEVNVTTSSSTILAVENAIIAWIRAVTGYSANNVYFAEQNVPKQSTPFITAKLTSFTAPNQDYVQSPDGTGVGTIIGDREFTLELKCTGDKAMTINPLGPLLDLRSSLQVVGEYKILQDSGLSFVDTLMAPTNITHLMDAEFEPRAAMDLRMRMVWSRTDSGQGIIEDTIIQAKYKRSDQIEITNNLITVQTTP